ncbi:MAG TPA: MFS transporter, partial [Candidatus Binatia bacterium]|nr:MFS transporter [Candidatus Binatia bacterium]
MAQAAGAVQKTSLKQVCVATLVGGVIEWYDFALYGLVAALVFNKLFFPSVDPTLGTLASLG